MEGQVRMQSALTKFCESGENMKKKYPDHDSSNVDKDISTIIARFDRIKERLVQNALHHSLYVNYIILNPFLF